MLTRIRDLIYKRHIGLVFRLNYTSNLEVLHKEYKYGINKSINQITDFYIRMGYSHFNKEIIKKHLANKVVFYNVKDKGKVIAIAAIFYNEVKSNGISFYSLLEPNKNSILMSKDTVYVGAVIVDDKYRGKNLFTNLMSFIMNELSKTGIDNFVLTTGASNAAMIKSCFNLNAELISIVEIIQYFKYFLKRNQLYYNSDQDFWGSF